MTIKWQKNIVTNWFLTPWTPYLTRALYTRSSVTLLKENRMGE